MQYCVLYIRCINDIQHLLGASTYLVHVLPSLLLHVHFQQKAPSWLEPSLLLSWRSAASHMHTQQTCILMNTVRSIIVCILRDMPYEHYLYVFFMTCLSGLLSLSDDRV